MTDNWLKPLSNAIPYMEYRSISKTNRHIWSDERHSHAVSELHIILKGSAKLEIADKVITLREGEAILIHPDTFHCNTEISTPFLRFSVSFLIKKEYRLRNDPEESYRIFNAGETILRACNEIFEECDRGDSFWREEMLSTLLSKLLIHVIRTLRQCQPDQSAANFGNLSTFQRIDHFFAVSTKQVTKDYSRKALAKTLHCSERQLNRLIYSLYGMTFQEKRQLARMDYAKFLLRNTNKTVNEISNLIGYSNESSFYKLFRSECGMTPQEFRNRHQQSSPSSDD